MNSGAGMTAVQDGAIMQPASMTNEALKARRDKTKAKKDKGQEQSGGNQTGPLSMPCSNFAQVICHGMAAHF